MSSSFPCITPPSFILCSFAVFALATARQNGYEVLEVQIGRTFFWSADAPMRKELTKFPAIVNASDLMISHLVRVENAIIASQQSGKAVEDNDEFKPCNHNDKKFGRSASTKMGIRGWPAPDVSCLSDVYGTQLAGDEEPPYTTDDIYRALYTRGKVTTDNIEQITRAVIANFTNPDFVYNWRYETVSQRCILHSASGYRVDGKWYLAFGITSHPVTAQVKFFARKFVNEFLRVVDGKLAENLKMCLPVRPEDGEEDQKHPFRTDTTTMISSARGFAPPSGIENVFIDENSAIFRALDESDLFVQQAEDAVTPSNIAILVLPLLLNVIPIALLAEVSTKTMLLYTLLSDVLTVVPLGIKGAELISIGLQRHRVVMTRMTSATNGTRPEAAAAALFGAECRAHHNVLPTGIAFLVLSIIFMVGGAAAEVVARHYEMKLKRNRLTELEETGLMLLSKGNSKPVSVSSKGSSRSSNFGSKRNSKASRRTSKGSFQPHTNMSVFVATRAHPLEAVGSPFLAYSYDEPYQNSKRDKKR